MAMGNGLVFVKARPRYVFAFLLDRRGATASILWQHFLFF
jgi:hypothetical protein